MKIVKHFIMQILLIEDNEILAKGLIYSLRQNKFEIEHKTNIKEARKEIEKNIFQLIILDISLPDGNGLEFYQNEIKKIKIPTIMLTAKDDEETIVKSLNEGVEDYITKPFRTGELIARINKIIRKGQVSNVTKIKDIEYNFDKMQVKKEDEIITLTSLELKILNLLFINKNKVVTRDDIIEKIWEWTGNDVDDHTVTVYFKRIREKLDTDIIKTIKGITILKTNKTLPTNCHIS